MVASKKYRKLLILIPNVMMLIWSAIILFNQINSGNIVKWKIVASSIGFAIFALFFIIGLIKIKNN